MTNTVITIVFTILYYAAAISCMRGVRLHTRNFCICGLMIAMTLLLESIRIPIPTGATIPLCSPLPLLLLAVLIDPRLAILSGWVCGILAAVLVPGWQPVHWGQFFVEHMVCFSCLGFAGIFGNSCRRRILCGLLLASFLKIIGHLLSGVLFFSQNAWDGWGAWGYSLGYNLSQNVPLCVLSGAVVLALPLKNLKKAIERNHTACV